MTSVVKGLNLIELMNTSNEVEIMALHRMIMVNGILLTSDGEMWSENCYEDAIGHELDLMDNEMVEG